MMLVIATVRMRTQMASWRGWPCRSLYTAIFEWKQQSRTRSRFLVCRMRTPSTLSSRPKLSVVSLTSSKHRLPGTAVTVDSLALHGGGVHSRNRAGRPHFITHTLSLLLQTPFGGKGWLGHKPGSCLASSLQGWVVGMTGIHAPPTPSTGLASRKHEEHKSSIQDLSNHQGIFFWSFRLY